MLGIGLAFLGVGAAATLVTTGIILIGIGLAGFAIASVLAIRGEVATARGKRT